MTLAINRLAPSPEPCVYRPTFDVEASGSETARARENVVDSTLERASCPWFITVAPIW
jgi:hypothetical protein